MWAKKKGAEPRTAPPRETTATGARSPPAPGAAGVGGRVGNDGSALPNPALADQPAGLPAGILGGGGLAVPPLAGRAVQDAVGLEDGADAPWRGASSWPG